MPPKPTKGAVEDSPSESPTAALLECLVGRAQKQDNTLSLLTELLLKQQKQSTVKDRYNPRGLPLPKPSDIPRFQGPLGNADSVLTHLRRLQQLLRTNSLLTPSDDEELEARSWLGRTRGPPYGGGWEEYLARLAMPSHWEYRESRTLFRLSLQEVSPNAWRKFDNAVILHRSHLHGTHHYPLDHEIARLYCAACPERLFLRLVDEPGFHTNDLDGLRVLISNHIERIAHEDAASQHVPRPIKTPASSASRSSDSAQLPQPPIGHQHPQCPSRTHHTQPKVNQLETELTAGDTTSAYLALAQTIPSVAEPIQDSSYALFHPLLAISVPIPADDLWPARLIRLLIDTGASTTFVDPKLAARLGWSVKTGAVRMRVRLAGGKAGPIVTDTVIGSFSLGDRMYQINGVVMDLHGTYDGILGLNFLARHGLLADTTSLVHLLEAGGANLSALGLRKDDASPSELVSATRLHHTEIHPTTPHATAAADSHSLTDVLRRLQAEFHDVFCDDLGDVRNFPTISRTRSGIHFEINLKHGATPKHSAPYRVPEALLPRFREMLLEHLNAGRLRYSSSPWASPAFLVSKGNGKFRMVCDFRALNNVTVPDMYPMGNVQDILHRAARKGKIFAKLDCKDAFFQTLMKEEDIPKTAITTPLGLLEWVVMPQGIRNVPAAQQRRINEALQGLTGECCEAYVDDIIIWGKDAKDLHDNISKLFLDEVAFLGHIIRPGQILPDPAKIARVKQFPLPVNSHQLHSFLGLVNYLRDFVPNLADHTAVLHATLPPNAAAEKAYYKAVKMHKGHLPEGWTGWRWSFGPAEKAAFEATRRMVSTVPCLAVIDYDAVKAGKQQVFLFTDASNTGTGAWIGVGTSRESAQPVAYDSCTFNSAQRNYPVHDRELLAIINALDHWRPLLYGIPVHVYCDHFTLQWFLGQRNLSPRQLQWLSTLKDFDLRIEYIKGEFNTLADYLSRHAPSDAPEPADPSLDQSPVSVHATMTYEPTLDPDTLRAIVQGYQGDVLFKEWLADPSTAPGVTLHNHDTHQLLLVDNRLCIPDVNTLREELMRQAHEGTARHLGVEKTMEILRSGYFWETMSKDANAPTTKPAGPLHLLPVPRDKFDDIAIDFVGPLPSSGGHDYLFTITDRLTGFIELVPCSTSINARDLAILVWDRWVSRYGLPLSITSDRDTLFTSRFWTTLWEQQNIKLKMSTAFHPQTDGASEHTNKTVVQLLRSWVDQHGKSWVKYLPRVSQAMNNTVRRSTGFSPAQLVFGRRLRTLPSLPRPPSFIQASLPTRAEWTLAADRTDLSLADARDNLILAKHRMAVQANRHRRPEVGYKVGDWVWLDTRNRLKEFHAGDGEYRAAKFFPRFQGPYQVQEANPALSVYRLHMNDQTYPKFHGHLLKPYLSSPRFHQTSPVTHQSDTGRRSILQILDDRVYRGHRQLRVVLSGDGPNGQWRNLDDLRTHDGFRALYDEYIGDDELAL
ncbi:hypothetical protein CNBN2080 [Cryptococcus deneoformans B-3501A]|uniref:hypothetical protein n=1 Tax=Cryptococcus deneoformans (strain B-3501A) TaxID=283643 RepID=UPI000042DA27|nr:hypothetical protein CNBN2080 [Cryptococcus neoformans var. neoformans B-3501A]EAL17162.1 hypothetical protein CNBN2080 [Cryptococcus neoformans var. neoformans B-3501A]